MLTRCSMLFHIKFTHHFQLNILWCCFSFFCVDNLTDSVSSLTSFLLKNFKYYLIQLPQFSLLLYIFNTLLQPQLFSTPVVILISQEFSVHSDLKHFPIPTTVSNFVMALLAFCHTSHNPTYYIAFFFVVLFFTSARDAFKGNNRDQIRTWSIYILG